MKRSLDSMAARCFDVLIVGGGIYGVRVAHAAALRGLAVALVERSDFGAATTANSLKIMHGGLRYLQTLDFSRMRESIRERRSVARLAPHLIAPMSFTIPCHGHGLRGPESMRVALALNDLIGIDRNDGLLPERRLPRGRVSSKTEFEALAPGFSASITGAATWYDGQAVNTERLLLAFLDAAVAAGAEVANYARVERLDLTGRRVTGAVVEDTLTQRRYQVRARTVVNAAGPWTDELLSQTQSSSRPLFVPSKALNFITRQLFADQAIGIPFEESNPGAVATGTKPHFFIVPWKRWSLIGTRHLPWSGPADDFAATERDVEIFLGEIVRAYPAVGLRRSDVYRVLAGMLPAEPGETDSVRLLTRYRIVDHAAIGDLDGLVTVVGVKWTTAGHVANKAVDMILHKLGERREPVTAQALPAGDIADWRSFVTQVEAAGRARFGALLSGRLAQTHGRHALAVLRMIEQEPSLGAVLDGESPTLAAEIVFAVRNEMAVRLEDVVFRRTELAVLGRPTSTALAAAGMVMARELQWDSRRLRDEIAAVESRAAEPWRKAG